MEKAVGLFGTVFEWTCVLKVVIELVVNRFDS
jgi:hypothetical protein